MKALMKTAQVYESPDLSDLAPRDAKARQARWSRRNTHGLARLTRILEAKTPDLAR